MAYTVPNSKIIFPPRGNRYLHKKTILFPVGADGSAVATKQVSTPPGRLVAYSADFTSQPATIDTLFKADTDAGVTLKTLADATDKALFPLGTTAMKSTAAVTSAVDAFSGGFPVRSGVYIDIAQGDGHTAYTKFVEIDLYFRLCTYVDLYLSADSGVDGSAVIARTIDLHGPGSLAAIAIDYVNMPNTTDITIKADSSAGTTLVVNHASGSNTDQAPTLIGRAGEDEAANVTAATDGTEGANMFKRKLYVGVAETNAFTSSNETIRVEMWIDQ